MTQTNYTVDSFLLSPIFITDMLLVRKSEDFTIMYSCWWIESLKASLFD